MAFDAFGRDVLIYAVDDEEIILQLYESDLIEAGYKIECFEYGKKAWEAIQNGGKPDLMLTDIHMPEMDGIQLVKRLREGGFDKPIIMVTGYADKRNAIEALSCGVSAMLEKPFSTPELLHRIKREVASYLRAQLNRELLQKFSEMSESMGQLLAKYEDRFTLAENIILEAKIDIKNEEKLQFIKNAKLSRELDSLMQETRKTIKEMHERQTVLDQSLELKA